MKPHLVSKIIRLSSIPLGQSMIPLQNCSFILSVKNTSKHHITVHMRSDALLCLKSKNIQILHFSPKNLRKKCVNPQDNILRQNQ